jgi:PIN domain nuclease of toxin-antitoxin system
MSSKTESPLLLDTHCWLWLAEGTVGQLSSAALQTLEASLKVAGLKVSVISVWEVGLLAAKGRVRLSRPVDEWMARALDYPGLEVCDVNAEIALESTRLPDLNHGDPADRFLVATARVQNLRFMTKDRVLLDYGRQGHMRVVPA